MHLQNVFPYVSQEYCNSKQVAFQVAARAFSLERI